jgi:hypothetical protein
VEVAKQAAREEVQRAKQAAQQAVREEVERAKDEALAELLQQMRMHAHKLRDLEDAEQQEDSAQGDGSLLPVAKRTRIC